MPRRHQLVVTGDYDTVVSALKATSLGMEPVLDGKSLVRFDDGNGFVHAVGAETVINLMDEDDGDILRELTDHLRDQGYTVEHRDLGEA